MTQKLTTADGFTLETATLTHHEDETDDYVETRDDATINRWTDHGHDRLYINDNFDDFYVDLETGEIEGLSGTASIDGDTLTVSYNYRSVVEKTYEYEITIEGGDFKETHECEECGRDDFESEHGVAVHQGIKHADEADDTTPEPTADVDETPTVAADGGTDATSHIRDSEIEDARQRLGDPDHPSELSISEYRTLLADLQQQLVDGWSDYLDAALDDRASIVYEDRDVVVLTDHENTDWNHELSQLDYETDVTGEVLKGVHHAVAGRLCEYSWESSDPLVVAKTDGWQLGETHVEHRVAQIAAAADVSEARAMDYYMVEIRGWSQSGWARFVGKAQQTVSDAKQEVEDGLGPELS